MIQVHQHSRYDRSLTACFSPESLLRLAYFQSSYSVDLWFWWLDIEIRADKFGLDSQLYGVFYAKANADE